MESLNDIQLIHAKSDELIKVRNDIILNEEFIQSSFVDPIERFLLSVADLEIEYSNRLKAEISTRKFISANS